MARIFITGSADGLGRAAAQTLLDKARVIVHARQALAAPSTTSSAEARQPSSGTWPNWTKRGVAEQVNRLGRVDAVIHNAGIYSGPNSAGQYCCPVPAHRPH